MFNGKYIHYIHNEYIEYILLKRLTRLVLHDFFYVHDLYSEYTKK